MDEPMIESYPEGTAVRLTKNATNLISKRELCAGAEFEVEDFVTAEGSGDGKAFYWLQRSDGSSVAVHAEVVEQVRTAEQQRARKLPEPKEILSLVGSALLDGDGIYETSVDGPNTVEVYGRADNNLTYGFRIAVTEIWKTDD